MFDPEAICWRGIATVDGLRSGANIETLLLPATSLARLMGDLDPASLTVPDAISLVVSHIDAMGSWRETSAERMARELARWSVQLDARGRTLVREITPADVLDFLHSPVQRHGTWADPAASSRRFRIAAARLLFRSLRQLHVQLSDPTLDLVVDGGRTKGTRALTDEEELVCRLTTAHTLTETRRPVAWALGQATATTGEQSLVARQDVDIENHRVWLKGTARRQARWGYLTEWGVEVVRRAAARAPEPDTGLIYGARTSRSSGGASACKAIHEIIRDAGYGATPSLRPMSLVAWAGGKIFEQSGDISVVATRLGMRSLDEASRLIGWEWRP